MSWKHLQSGSETRRVLHVVSGLMDGGGQRVACRMVASMQAMPGLEARLATLGDRVGRLANHAAHRVPYDGRYNRPWVLWLAAIRFRRILKEFRPHVVHSHGWDASMVGGLASWGTDSVHVAHWHTTDAWLASPKWRHGIRRLWTRAGLSGVGTRVVAVSTASRNWLCAKLGWPEDRVAVIPNGVDCKVFRPGSDARDGAIVGAAARLCPGKGLDDLLYAVASIHSKGGAMRLRIAGEGPQRKSLEALSKQLGISEAVEFLGHVEQMADFYRSIGTFVLPSHSEGMPLTVLEAMASGCAVIATRVGGVPEVIEHARTGCLVDPRDRAQLESALLGMCDGGGRESMASAGAMHVRERFGMERFVSQCLDAYAGLGGLDHPLQSLPLNATG